LTTLASSALALVLMAALVVLARIDLAQVLALLANAKPLPFLALVVLTSLYLLLSAEKWRLVEQRLAPGTELSRRLCFAFTGIGMAAGQILPMQVSTALTRAIGKRVLRGTGAVRSAVATVFEQLFDFAVSILCGSVSLYVLWSGRLDVWFVAAGSAIVLCLLLLGPLATAAMTPVPQPMVVGPAPTGRMARFRRAVVESGLFEVRLARRLFALSVVRFILLWLMAIATTKTVGLNISAVQLAATLPLVVLASQLIATPANIGVNEGTFAAVLTGLGVDLETAAQFALVNRVLVAAAALIMGAIGAILMQSAAAKDAEVVTAP